MSTLEDILANQQQLVNATEQVYTNFKKDPAERKTPDYIKRRLDTLDKYWQEYQSNYSLLLGIEYAKSHSYFTNNHYELAKERYENVRAVIYNYQRKDDRPLTPVLKPATPLGGPGASQQPTFSVSQGNNSKTDEMLRKQFSNIKAFDHTVSNINVDILSEKWEFEHILRVVQSRWSTIDALHWDLDSELGDRNQDYQQSYLQHERAYNHIIKAINRKLSSVSHREHSTPHMEIPTFTGTYSQWSSFKDLFTETVHSNPSLSSAQKMQFLKSKVRGEAERLIQHLPISSDNYAICWDILNHRYNNKRLILNAHIDTMLAIPVATQSSINHIKKIHDATRESLNAIKNLGVQVDSWDPLIIHLLCQKLDTETHGEYIASVKQPREIPNLEEFLTFLENKFTTMESSRRKQDQGSKSLIKTNHTYQSATNNYKNHKTYNMNNKSSFNPTGRNISQSFSSKGVYTTKYSNCPICNINDHGIFHCQQFLHMSPFSRRKIVSKLDLCENCLYCHRGKVCISEKYCRECQHPHNTLLHEAFVQRDNKAMTPKTAAVNEKAGSSNALRSNSHVSLQSEIPEILLATAIIKVQAADGTFVRLRALIDQGSQTSLITENAAQLLGLPRQRCQGVISGVGTKLSNCKGAIHIKCLSDSQHFEFETDALIMKNLIKNLPSNTFPKPDWSYLNNIRLADPEFNISRPVDLLFGADVYSLIILEGICRGEQNSPIAQNTRLGWILSGCAKTFQCNVILNELEDIQKFWEIEDITDESNLSLEDQECIKYYKDTTTRCEDGRFEVRLPLKSNFAEELGLSKNRAIAQYKSLEIRLSKNQEMEQNYKSFMQEYQSMGHMNPTTVIMKPDCYLTHHSVEKTESTSTKFRVVFNASVKTSSGKSLNDVMKRGPNLQQDLQALIIKWRQYQFAFTADIEKMFRQIWIHKQDQSLQKIIWRNSVHEPLTEYQLSTVTYGTKAAPFLAMMTLHQLASDERSNYNSNAAEVLEKSFYMDDLVHGTYQLEQAIQLRNDLIKLLKSGGFNLRKWKSNVPQLSDEFNNDQKSFNFKQAESEKTLGLCWEPQHDVFKFNLKIESDKQQETKRSLLSSISKLFDPLGWLAPLSTKLKIIFQAVWMSNIKWDDPLPQEILLEWIKINNELCIINDIKVPRWLSTNQSEEIELHGFCDSSEKAYACVVYCKIKRCNMPIITLVVAKSRLVPAGKTISLPRLELSAALLLSKLMKKLQNCLTDLNIKVYGWSDSMIVLGWLNGDPARWRTFVANRVKEITNTIPPTSWHYVKSEENPADCASRGLNPSKLIQHDLWWKGPSWLSEFEDRREQQQYTTDLETKAVAQVNVITDQTPDIITKLLSSYSSISKIIRITAYVFRFINKNKDHTSFLSLFELTRAENHIIKCVQQMEYFKEIINIKEKGHIHPKSNISSLYPFIDEHGLLRVGGRLKNTNMHPDIMHPIIVPGHSRLAVLLIDQAHKATFHGGARLTSAYLRERYWIVGGNRIIKKQLRQCVKCRRHDPVKHQQLMGDLPASRTTPSRPFYHTGVDFTGYVDVKSSKGRGIKSSKGYIAVFVCMVTKAVHLELVSDLSASAFIAALRRMTARRGTPSHIYSDNGTNFVGASRTLNKEYHDIKTIADDNFMTIITEMKIQWHFNAPAWPSAGGLWEAAVKSLKYHLKRVIGDQKLTFEEYSTLLAQLEACLNTRPLCAMTEDPEDISYLTPSHFLASGPTLTIVETERDLRTRWQLTQKIFDDVWKRWRSEYLSQLNTRSKWRQSKDNVDINDIVIIHDANLPAGKWALGRIIHLHPGKDDLVRVVSIKTKNNLIKRPITKISKLPVNNAENEKPLTSSTINQPQRKNRKSSKLQYLLTLLLWLFMFISQADCKYQITSLNTSQGFYFDKISNIRLERDHWNLVVYYDMTPYWDSTSLLNKYIKHLDNLCYESNKTIAQCEAVLLQLHHGMSELMHYNSILLGKQLVRGTRLRRRRGLINGVGYVARRLFGVLDQEFAEQYEQDIAAIRQNQNHQVLLWRNQTSVIEAEFNLIKRVEASIEKHTQLFNQHLSNLENALNQQRDTIEDVSKANTFTLSTVVANGLLSNLRQIQETLITSLTNIFAGKFNFHLLTPDQLKNEMSIITSVLSKDLTLPMNNQGSSLLQMYSLLAVKARATKKFIIFEIKIPLVSRDNYELYKIIPIPQQTDNSMISLIPISPYMAINLQKDTFIPIPEIDIPNCVDFDFDSHICPLRQLINHIKSEENLCVKRQQTDQCQTMTSICKPIWIELSITNTYLFFCCGQCHIRIICDDHITAAQLQKAGIITLSGDCILKSDSFTIYPHKMQTNALSLAADVIKIDIPPINNIFNLSLPVVFDNRSANGSENQKYFENVDQQIKRLKDSADAEVYYQNFSYHDVHHYVVTYILVFVAVIVAAVWLRRSCLRRRRASRRSRESPRVHLETQKEAGDTRLPTTTEPSSAVRCVSESAVNQCSGYSGKPVKSESHINRTESNNSLNACVINRACSPVLFHRQF